MIIRDAVESELEYIKELRLQAYKEHEQKIPKEHWNVFKQQILSDEDAEQGVDQIVAVIDGKFLILDVTVENGKNEAITIDSNYFKIITGEGTEYEPHSSGDVMMALGDEATDFFLEQINPNLDKTGKVVFEVSDDVELSESVLHAQTGFFGTESIEISLSE